MMLLKLAAAPLAVWLSSLAGRRWGHRVAGLIGGFPLIAAPIVLFIALDAPRAFAADLAWMTVATAPGAAAHCFAYAWLARAGWRWPACLAVAWAACVGLAWVLSGIALRGPAGFALALGLGLALARAMPRARGSAVIAPIPGAEILVRMACALVLAAVIMFGAQTLGTRVSGVLLGFPVTASVLPVFTLALHGPDAAIRLLSGFIVGLLGFVTYFYAFASLVPQHGPWIALGGGLVACVAAVSAALAWQRRGAGARP
ncbi:MAG: hypothetical protein JNM90_16575 [Burkholderiales bacterium]|nr:hypothetical protein [Burkholderiales bacterium]